jgi:hypothetical protein
MIIVFTRKVLNDARELLDDMREEIRETCGSFQYRESNGVILFCGLNKNKIHASSSDSCTFSTTNRFTWHVHPVLESNSVMLPSTADIEGLGEVGNIDVIFSYGGVTIYSRISDEWSPAVSFLLENTPRDFPTVVPVGGTAKNTITRKAKWRRIFERGFYPEEIDYTSLQNFGQILASFGSVAIDFLSWPELYKNPYFEIFSM